jgi:hypothetical protein
MMVDDQEALEEGVLQMLGKKDMPKPEVSKGPCDHESDGYIYDEKSTYRLLMCVKCLCQYEEMK